APSAVRFAFDLASANPGEQLERFGLPAQGLPALALSGRARIGEGRVAIDADRIAFGGDAPLTARAVWDVRAQPAALSVSIDNQRLVLGDIVAEPVSLDAVLQGGRLQLDVHAFALPARALAVRGSYGSDDADGMALELAGDLHGEPFRLRGRTAVPWRHAGWRDGTAVFPVRGQLDYRDARLAFNGGIDRLAGAASAMHADLDLRTRKPWRLLGAADDGQSLAAPFNAAARLRLRGLVAELSAISLTAGDSALGGRIEVDVTGELPVVDGALHGERVHMHDLRALWPTGAGDLDREPDAPIRLPSPERLPLRGALLLSVDRLVLRNAEISTLRAGAVISDDELTLELARADLWNGRIAAAFERRRGRDAQMRVELNDVEFAYFRNQDADQARLRAPFDFVATITGQGEDIDAFIGSANGNIGFAMGTGTVTIPGLDFLGRGLFEVLIPGFRANPTVALNCAAARFDLDGGVLASRGLVIDLKPVTIGGGGVIDFNQELLEIALVPRAKRRQFISLVAPVHITGSLSNPRVETELQGLTVRALGDLLLASIAPWLLVVPLIVPADDPLQQAEVCLQAIADQNDDPPALIDQAPRRYPSGR
ncbi:MAG: AsmA-like C-terminal region-containing protein, partial [Geminicoccaceae bacterium]